MKKTLLKTTLTLAVTAASTQLLAGGFSLNEQSVSGMGTGYAGRSSSADDATTVFGNPAGMSRLKRDEVSLGVAAIDAKTDLRNTSSTLGGSNKGDMVPFTTVPMGFYVHPIDEHWAVGLGVYAPFGLITNYENGFAGRYLADKSEVKVITVQPTVSYAFNDKVSIGIGPTFNRLSGTLSSDVATLAGDSSVKVKGDDTAVGYNVGLLVQATDTTRLGLTYHSKVSYDLTGHTNTSGGALAFAPANRFDASLGIDTPESVDFSVTQKLNDDLTLYAGTTWTRWSRLKAIDVSNSGPVAAAIGLGNINEEQNWHNTWSQAVGLAYQLNKQWVLRTGLSLDQSPTNNTDRSPRIPTGDRTAVSFGAGYSPTDDITIDVAYSYLKEEDTKVNLDSAQGLNYTATYHNSANGFGTSVTYRF